MVATVNVVDVEPAGTRTVAGTVISPGTPTVSLTSQPPAGAADVKETVPVVELPAVTELGLTDTLARPSPVIVRAADFAELPSEA